MLITVYYEQPNAKNKDLFQNLSVKVTKKKVTFYYKDFDGVTMRKKSLRLKDIKSIVFEEK